MGHLAEFLDLIEEISFAYFSGERQCQSPLE
jgi:hypothetical protein